MTLGDPDAVGALVLLVVFGVGVLAGRARGRFLLLLVGLVVVVAAGAVVGGVTGTDLSAPPEVLGPRLGDVYAVVVPPAVAFLAGWLAARGSWFGRAVVVGVAVLLLAALPYGALGAATAGAVTG